MSQSPHSSAFETILLAVQAQVAKGPTVIFLYTCLSILLVTSNYESVARAFHARISR